MELYAGLDLHSRLSNILKENRAEFRKVIRGVATAVVPAAVFLWYLRPSNDGGTYWLSAPFILFRFSDRYRICRRPLVKHCRFR